MIDYCGGYLRTRYQNGVNYIDFVKEYGGTASQEIELGKNLLDLSEEVSVEDLFTVLIPLGDDNLTIASVNGGQDEIVDQDAVALYGRIVRTHVFNNVNDPSTLAENGVRYLLNNINVPRTVTITAVDLHILDHTVSAIRLGDRVHISSGPHSMDEFLVCTKIEYDMSNPANDKYTFGNPKQSLTERYKEDKRIQNDVYGNSAASGGGGGRGGGSGGAAAAEAAADAAEAIAEEVTEETERKIGEFFDSYIDLDPEDDGHIKLGSFYKEWTGAKEILLNDVGIDLDIATGNINIKSLKNMVDNNYEEIGRQSGRIDVLQEDTQVSLSALTERIEEVNGIHQEHYTEIRQVSSQNASQISIVAGELQGEINRATAKEASIDLIVENQQSQINIKADKTYVDTELLTVTGLIQAESAKFDKLVSGQMRASFLATTDMSITGNLTHNDGYGYPLAYGDHSHSIAANNDGTVTIGYSSGRDKGSFNIADTKFYKDGVSAAIQSVTVDSIDKNGALDYSTTYKRYNVPVIATASNGKTGTATLVVGATDAYNHGYNSVTVSSLGATWSGYTLNVTAKASNGSPKSASWSADWIYNQGYSDGQDAGSGGIDKIYITMISGSSVGVRAYFGSSYNFAWLSAGAYWDGG